MGDVNWWLLVFGTLGLASQMSQLPKHIDPSRNTVFQEMQIAQENLSNVLGANPVPEAGDVKKANFDQVRFSSRFAYFHLSSLLFKRERVRVTVCD